MPPVTGSLATSAVLLPDGTPTLPTASRLYKLVDAQGRTHVTRRRLFAELVSGPAWSLSDGCVLEDFTEAIRVATI